MEEKYLKVSFDESDDRIILRIASNNVDGEDLINAINGLIEVYENTYGDMETEGMIQ